MLSPVLVHELLHFGVGIAQLPYKLLPVVLLVQKPDVFHDQPQESIEGRLLLLISNFECFLNDVVPVAVQNDFISLHGVFPAAHRACFS